MGIGPGHRRTRSLVRGYLRTGRPKRGSGARCNVSHFTGRPGKSLKLLIRTVSPNGKRVPGIWDGIDLILLGHLRGQR